MWKLIFDNVTKRGTGCNREPQDGEFAIDRHPSECAWFNAEPERYQYVDGVFSEVEISIIDAELLEKNKRVMIRRVRAERDARSFGGIKNLNRWYASSLQARHDYMEWKDTAREMLAAGAELTDNLIIDGDTVVLESLDDTIADRIVKIEVALDLVEKAKALDRALDRRMRAHIAAIKLSTDPLNYDFSTGWPVKF